MGNIEQLWLCLCCKSIPNFIRASIAAASELFMGWFLHQPFPIGPRFFVVFFRCEQRPKRGRDLSQFPRAASGGTNVSHAPRLWGNPRKLISTSLKWPYFLLQCLSASHFAKFTLHVTVQRWNILKDVLSCWALFPMIILMTTETSQLFQFSFFFCMGSFFPLDFSFINICSSKILIIFDLSFAFKLL